MKANPFQKKVIDEGLSNLAHALGALGEEISRAGCSASEFLTSMSETMEKSLNTDVEYGWISRSYIGEYPRREAMARFKNDCLDMQATEGWMTLDEPFIEEVNLGDSTYGYRITQKCWRLCRSDGLFKDSKVYVAEEDTWVRV